MPTKIMDKFNKQKDINLYEMIDNICHLYNKKKYIEGEKILISLIKEIINKSHLNGSILKELNQIHSILYISFNSYYFSWLNKNKTVGNLDLNLHQNYLISKTSHIAEIDDLLFELGQLLNSSDVEKQTEEVIYHLECYQKLIK